MATSGKLKTRPVDKWSLREKLALVCSVMRSGDQNWVSVSRAIRSFAEADRPSDWFSQKNCAMQYSQLLDTVDIPKRKRTEKGEHRETPIMVIFRKMTIERIEELKTLVKEEQERYRKLKTEVETIRAGQMDDKLKEMWAEIEVKNRPSDGAIPSALTTPTKLPDEFAANKNALFSKIKRETAGLRLKIPGTEAEEAPPGFLDEQTAPSVSNDDNISSLTLGDATAGFPDLDIKQEEGAGIPPELLSDLLENSPALQRALNETKEQLIQKDLKGELEELGEQVVVVEEGTEVVVDDFDVKEEPVSIEVTNQVQEEEVKVEVEVTPDSGSGCIDVSSTPEGTTTKPDPVVVGGEVTVKSEGEQRSSAEPSVVVDDGEERKEDIDVESIGDGNNASRSKRVSVETQQVEVVTPDLPDTPTGGAQINLSSSALEVEEPASPASSVVSNETDTGSTRSRSVRRSRGGKSRRMGRRRGARRRVAEEERKESESSKPSEAETSDDDCAPSDDAGSHTTGKQLLSVTDSVPNSPASGHSVLYSDIEDEKAHKNWKKSIMLVWRSAAIHKYANVFLHPVTEDIAPGYGAVVYRPMDLSTIKRNIDSGSIRTTAEFQRDMMLMFTNAIMYNSANHDVYKMATEMYDDVMQHIEQFVSTQLMVQSETKVLRASSRTRSDLALSDKEEDPKKRKLGSVPEVESGGKKKRKL